MKSFIVILGILTFIGLAFYLYPILTKGIVDENTIRFNKDTCSIYQPKDPYDQNTDHFKGFEWGVWAKASNSEDCSNGSYAFIEGCNEYLKQAIKFKTCLSNSWDFKL
ncbi:MAG: hypothetical protein WCW87_02250 [Candidatus Paceibacterota bacterium]